MELGIHVKNLLQTFILIALGIYWVELICELNRLFFLLCWLFSKTVSCSHAGHPLLPRASYPNVHLRLWCQERFHWLSPWGLTSETQMRLGTILFIRPKISIVFYFFWRSLTTSNWLAGCSLRWWKIDIILAPKQFQTSSEGKPPTLPHFSPPTWLSWLLAGG